MGSVGGKWNNEEYSVIEDKGQLEFVDFQDDKSVCSYFPDQEGPIVISVPFPFLNGKPQSALVGERAADSITIKNTTKEPVELWNVTIYASTPEKSFMLSLMEPPPANADERTINAFVEFECLEDRVLQPLEVLTVWLSCKPKEIGLHQTAVQFDVGDDRLERVVFLLADDKVSHSLTSKRPYSRNTKKKQVNVESYVAGSKPAGKVTNRSFKNRLQEYKIPKDVRELVESKQIPDVLNEELWKGNYSSYFKMLLIMEEIQLEEDMRNYDMESVSMKRKGNQYLALEVPGLAEKRPSLVQGDFILAKHASGDASDTSPGYQGYIHRVEADEVYLKFDQEFHFCHRDGNLYDVKFTYNRFNMRRLYQAIEAAERLDTSFLFPSDSSRRRIKTFKLHPISCTLNEEQIRSVEMILGCRGAPPYVIHGPPGTGKTMTLVEALLQLYKHRRNARILVCAPSNTAADNILEKLLNQKAVKLMENSIFRLNAASRPYEDVRPDLIPFCFYDELIFKCPPLSALVCHRVIISTYMSASVLYAEGIARGHFTHIFLDEAGQASEPETMVPISNLSRRDTVVVLAGDPLQLGPVVYSKEALNYGYGKSYLERLFESKAYSDEDKNYVTKLVRNYRSHAQILHLPSNLFYNGELIACREDNSINSLLEFIPNKEFPILFVGVQGCDEREGNNPSWFNRIEASKVVEIIKKLMTSDMGLSEEDIGVITPYRQQVLKLKKALENCDVPDIKVGSVEQFQGQERKVIIVSTVRSTVKHNNFDRSHCLGFLSNPRRFNVAVTRAIALLIIIGNPHIICQDTYWNKLLWHCLDNDSYQGCAPPSRVDNDLNNEENCQWSEKVESWKDDEWGKESWNQNSWNADPSNQNSWNEDPSNQNSWNEDPSNQNSWNEDPSNQNSWNEDPSNQNSWNEDPSNQNSWNDEPSNQNSWNDEPSNQSSWNEDPSKQNSWNEDPSNQSSWKEDPNQKSWNDEPSNQKSWNEEDPSNQKSWNEEDPSNQKPWNDEDPSNQKPWNDEEPSNQKSWNEEDPSNQKSWNDEEPSKQKSWNDDEPSKQKSWNDEEPSKQKSWNDDEPSKQKSWNDDEPSKQKPWNDDEPSDQKPLNKGSWSEAWDLGPDETKIPKSVAEEAEEWK